ncbi:MAG TPA: RNA polymerase sigma-70 factor [Hanamia sp.]|nr:RNA polymerase sigma-70 factor [Hanamia sp.]
MKMVFKKKCAETFSEDSPDDKEVFRKLFEKFKNKVYSYSLHITHSEIFAEDITQEVFMKVWLQRNSLGDINNMEAWIITIARNLCFNQLKKEAREQKLIRFGMNNQVQENVDDYITYKDRLNELRTIVNKLPKQQRIIFNLNRMEGLKNEEIARQLDISANTVKSHFTKALQTIRQTMHTNPTMLILAILVIKFFI